MARITHSVGSIPVLVVFIGCAALLTNGGRVSASIIGGSPTTTEATIESTETTTTRLHRSTFQEQFTSTTPLPPSTDDGHEEDDETHDDHDTSTTTIASTSDINQRMDSQPSSKGSAAAAAAPEIVESPSNLTQTANQNSDSAGPTQSVPSAETSPPNAVPAAGPERTTNSSFPSVPRDVDSERSSTPEPPRMEMSAMNNAESAQSVDGGSLLAASAAESVAQQSITESPIPVAVNVTEITSEAGRSSERNQTIDSIDDSVDPQPQESVLAEEATKEVTARPSETLSPSPVIERRVDEVPFSQQMNQTPPVSTTPGPSEISKISPTAKISTERSAQLSVDAAVPPLHPASGDTQGNSSQPTEPKESAGDTLQEASSIEELPSMSMMALKAPALVEFSYKEGTPKPPVKIESREPAEPIGEIGEDDQVEPTIETAEDQPGPSKGETHQPEGVLEVARIVTKFLEDKFIGLENKTLEAPVIVAAPQPMPVPTVQPLRPVDIDYDSIESMRIRARVHNGPRKPDADLDTQASARSHDVRTSKIMNTVVANSSANGAAKDKMIFIRTVPKGSLTTASTPSTVSPALPAKSNDYDDPEVQLVDEDDVIKTTETVDEELPTEIVDLPTSPGGLVEDRPVMAQVVQSLPNENSLSRPQLKPLDTKDLQISFILPAVTEPTGSIDTKTPSKSPATESPDELPRRGGEADPNRAVSPIETKYAKPYPLQEVQKPPTKPTKSPNSGHDDRDYTPTSNPVVALAGGEKLLDNGEFKLDCPPKEDIHPCNCIKHTDDFDGQVETVATCRNIKHSATLIEALRGFRGHRLTYLIIDNSEIPPFPNNILHRIQVDWMEVLNTSVQFKREYLQCSIKCTLS